MVPVPWKLAVQASFRRPASRGPTVSIWAPLSRSGGDVRTQTGVCTLDAVQRSLAAGRINRHRWSHIPGAEQQAVSDRPDLPVSGAVSRTEAAADAVLHPNKVDVFGGHRHTIL